MTNFKVSALVMDVDGTLTDGQIHISPTGEAFKSFDVKDGYAVHDLLPQMGIVPVIITGRHSDIVAHRAKELGIQELHQGVADKGALLREIAARYGLSREEIACIGDDCNDLSMMELCGICACPADAVQAVKKKCDYVCKAKGGRGAVREFVEWLMENNAPCGTG